MRLGKDKIEALRQEITGEVKPGYELVVSKPVALAGTALITKEKYEDLKIWFSERFLQTAMSFGAEEAEEIEWQGARYPLGEGGVLAAVWKMATAWDVGVSIQMREIPIRQETIEICERLELNPYKLYAAGSVLYGTERGTELVHALAQKGIEAKIIGFVEKGNAKVLYNGDHEQYLERPSKDEVYKIKKKKKGIQPWQN